MSIATITARNINPTFAHDCDGCRFLGSLNGEDLYVCADGYIRRFGNEGSEYGSLGDLAPAGTPYAFAAKLAQMNRPPHAYATVAEAPSCWRCHGPTIPWEAQGVVGWACRECGSFSADDSPEGVKASNRNAIASNHRGD